MKKARANYLNQSAYCELGDFLKDLITNDTIIICIGTDRCIGDCLGPLVGTLLKKKLFPLPVYGTIKNPIHALNLEESVKRIKCLHPKASVIGIDACLGSSDNIGEIQIRPFPIHPGKGVGKTLPDVGDISIIGIVDSCDNNELFTNRNIRLDLIMDMAEVITDTLIYAYSLYKKL
ncbi:spore protease YyaC [Clostridium cellulovorans]|uniref:Sporulation protein YyaC n=1 Tax=Clostridium cellulovorans (strain ATCC 35296 / DSM 3052 / OCM 3 / 743B) TaxID=573061 RepID=D9STJ7_CLOC7|nr:spore protease YyaC [Clostridium cellulovorans]ADL52731.1 sporulation protein YyaC [Clostridium cellulovorans 743B]